MNRTRSSGVPYLQSICGNGNNRSDTVKQLEKHDGKYCLVIRISSAASGGGATKAGRSEASLYGKKKPVIIGRMSRVSRFLAYAKIKTKSMRNRAGVPDAKVGLLFPCN